MTLGRTVFRLSDTEFEWHWLLMNFSHGKTFGHWLLDSGGCFGLDLKSYSLNYIHWGHDMVLGPWHEPSDMLS
jgi:hypothetical protein